MDNYFRCPWCGSSAVSTETKKEGYDIKKGLIGTALFGTGGAVMGINMNEKKYNYCQMCRKTFTQCMPVATIKDIERLLRDSNGDHPLLKMYKNHYPNFEMDNIINANNNSSVNIDKLSAEELADTLYEYCKKYQIKEIKEDDLCNRIAGKMIGRAFEALRILEKRGVAKYNSEKKDLWYNFYLTEEEIEKNLIRNGMLDDAILADKIYEYCEKHQIKEIEIDDLNNRIAGEYIKNSFEALEILEKRGVVEYNSKKSDSNEGSMWYNFYFNTDKSRIKDTAIEEIKKYKELLDLEIITQEEFDKKKKELLNL